MSEIALTNSTNHHYVSDYSNGSMMININPSLVQKADTSNPSPPVAYEDGSHSHYSAYPGIATVFIILYISLPTFSIGYTFCTSHLLFFQ
jgi:hypothetical protein